MALSYCFKKQNIGESRFMKKTKKHMDYIYEASNYFKRPKETFIFLAKLISSLPFSKNFNPSILDIGCTNGAFLAM